MSSKQQDYTEYTVDLSQLTKERPLGVTGILRCQNSADFLDACIESCIEGLDELRYITIVQMRQLIYLKENRANTPTRSKSLNTNPISIL